MDAVTYPHEGVSEFINKSVIPLRVSFDAQPLAKEFNVQWTPTLVMLDTEGGEHHRTVGFLAADELIPAMLLGIGKTHLDLEMFPEALSNFDRLLADYPKSDATPEAIYFRGVARYKSTHDPKPLKEAYEKLQAQYPSSEWTRRAYPYRLL